MIRRILIIQTFAIVESYLKIARENDCPEICSGIPPTLEDKLKTEALPCIYEEDVPDVKPAPSNIELDERLKALEEGLKQFTAKPE